MSVLDPCHEAGLRRRHAEPHRVYHGQAHIDSMLRAFHAERGRAHDPAALELAIWYHDAIYDPAAADNEARSADLLRTEQGQHREPGTVARAAQLVEWTARHTLPADLPAAVREDAAWFMDLDVAILGAAAARYDAYERGIAAEYVPIHGEPAYRAGRRAFLSDQLARSRLFLTDDHHALLDRPARSNMRRAIEQL